MIDFNFSRAGLKFDNDLLAPYKEKFGEVISKLTNGDGEFIFSKLPSEQSLKKVSEAFARRVRSSFTSLIVVGIGGSSLGARALLSAVPGDRIVYFMENIDPESISKILNKINPRKTAVNFVSRSGTTLETISQYIILREFYKEKLGKNFYKNFFVTTSAEGSFLGKEALRYGYEIIRIPKELTGRYSVLSPVGMVPAGFAGLKVSQILAGAEKMKSLCLQGDLQKNPSAQFAITCYHHYLRGRRIIVLMPYMDSLFAIGEWFAQLWAESLGKVNQDGKPVGQTPVRGIGTQDQHSLLQLYLDGPDEQIVIFITGEPRRDLKVKKAEGDFEYLNNRRVSEILMAEQQATAEALYSKGKPSIHIHLKKINEVSLGGLFYFFETSTVFMSSLLKVNAFDQPAVEEIKKITRQILSLNTR